MLPSKQIVLGVAANISCVALGLSLGISAVIVPSMQISFLVTDDQTSWIVATSPLGMAVGGLLVGPSLTGLGRRRTLMLFNITMICGFILIAVSPRIEPWFLIIVCTGRFLSGVSVTLLQTTSVVYVSETLHKDLRAMVLSWNTLAISAGLLLVYVLGYIFKEDWRLVTGLCALSPTLSFIAAWIMLPETPVWLMTKQRVQEAEQSLRRFRRTCSERELQGELDAMITSSHDQSGGEEWRDKLSFLKRPEAYKPLFIFTSFFIFQQFSGIYIVFLYAVTLVRSMGVTVDEYVVTVFVGVSRLVATIINSYFAGKYGRRLLCVVSGVGMVVSLVTLAVTLSVVQSEEIRSNVISWLQIVALVIFIFFSTPGFLSLPFTMIGEVFPLKIRGSAAGFCFFFGTMVYFASAKLFPKMRNTMGISNVFILYTAVTVIGTIVMFFFLPETRGKTLNEIEESFKRKNKRHEGAMQRTAVPGDTKV